MSFEVYGVIWNISRLKEAASVGVFGTPLSLPRSVLEPDPASILGITDAAHVNSLKLQPSALTQPAIIIADHEGNLRAVCDGNHRLAALYDIGAETFRAYIVPARLEVGYRIPLPALQLSMVLASAMDTPPLPEATYSAALPTLLGPL